MKILIADSQYLTRKGILDFFRDTTFEATILEVFNREELFDVLTKNHPRLLLIDYDLFDFNSVEEFCEIKKLSPETTIIIITNNCSHKHIKQLLDAGINNYVLKTAEIEELKSAITAGINNKKYFSQEVLDILVDKTKKSTTGQKSVHLTSSETEIVKLIAQGLTTKEIAAKKNLSFHTIITHRKNIFKKLDINNTSELVSYAYKTGIIDATEYYI